VFAFPSVSSAADRVTVGHTNSASDVGVFVAQDNGHFAAAGIEVQLEGFDSGSRMSAPFASGDLDVGGGATSAALYNAVGRKIGIRIVADKTSSPPGRTNLSVVVRKDLIASGRYKTLPGLRG
jgi:NitT/TauT family transport system substrate-binding protein